MTALAPVREIHPWVREPDPAWVRELAQIAAPNTRVSWLLIYWEPGDPWERLNRWMIREMDPRLEYVHADLLAEYNGPSPRTDGQWILENGVRKWRGAGNLSLRQWELFQQYQCTSRRVWVCQGPDGGHPFEKSQAERMFLRAHGLPGEDTPRPGELPYSEPDARTWARLAAYDKMQRYRQNWEARQTSARKAGLTVMKEWDEDYKQWGWQALKFYSEGIKEAIDGVPRGTLQALYDASPKRDGPPEDEERIERRFVESTPYTNPE